MKIAAYCRVSTAKAEQLDSLANQKAFFSTYASRYGHELVCLYADEGISGTSLKKREEFLHLMRDAEVGKFEMVVVKDISRFARNTVDALQSIRRLKELGINTLFLNTNMDSMGDSEFILTLFSAMAQEESANISKRTKFGKQINAEKGRVPQCVFGYHRVDNFTLEIHPQEAEIVRKIFQLYNQQGLGCRSISLQLNREGAQTKFGGQWNPRGVRRILVNPLYCGILVNHKYEIQDFLTGRQVALPESQRFYHQRPEWAIIPPEAFQRAQEIMQSRRKQFDSGQPFRQGRYSGKHLFSTLIKCQHCGRSFCRKTYTYANTRVYWRCVTNDQYTAQRCENRVCLDEDQLMEQLKTYLSSQIAHRDAFVKNVLFSLQQNLPKPGCDEKARAELETRRKKLLSKRERYQELFASELLSLPELKKKLEDIQRELQDIEKQESKQAEDPQTRWASQVPHFTEEIHRFLDMETLTNSDLRRILDHISVRKDGTVQVVLKKLHEFT